MKRDGPLPAFLVFFLLMAAAATAQKADKPPSVTGESPTTLQQQTARKPIVSKWTGDLDGMIERRLIRILTTYSKTHYFVDQATQRGLVFDTASLFEEDLNKKLRNKNIRVNVVVVPVSHDELIPALLEGRGDIVAAGTMITDLRREKGRFYQSDQDRRLRHCRHRARCIPRCQGRRPGRQGGVPPAVHGLLTGHQTFQ